MTAVRIDTKVDFMEEKNAELSQKLVEFYDGYVPVQQNSGINDRIHGLYKRLLKAGLNTHSRVLELGCGIGSMTYLLSRTVKKGFIESVDISPESIAFAQQRIRQSNISLTTGNILHYIPKQSKFDFITLFDVIEHIPMENHKDLFKNISRYTDEETRILINIPNPDYIEYDIQNQPQLLQVIDQPVPLDSIVNQLKANRLNLVFFENYSVWVEQDYQFFIIHKAKAFTEIRLSDHRNLFSKAKKKCERIFIKWKYPYC
ncbi:MAG: class I SAM-dependent methyltransferase [Bacteroidota bacterium]|nr:class I SAM-dependent methyltransferase [Bacteroidota bacterium]